MRSPGSWKTVPCTITRTLHGDLAVDTLDIRLHFRQIQNTHILPDLYNDLVNNHSTLSTVSKINNLVQKLANEAALVSKRTCVRAWRESIVCQFPAPSPEPCTEIWQSTLWISGFTSDKLTTLIFFRICTATQGTTTVHCLLYLKSLLQLGLETCKRSSTSQ